MPRARRPSQGSAPWPLLDAERRGRLVENEDSRPKIHARAIAMTWRSPPTACEELIAMVTRVMPKLRISSTAILSALAMSRCGTGPALGRLAQKEVSRDAHHRNRANFLMDVASQPRASRGLEKRVWTPSTKIAPELGGWNPDRILISVDLPAPLSPSRHRIEPGWTDIETSLSAECRQSF